MEQRDFAGERSAWLQTWHWKGMVPVFDCFDRPFRWHSEGAWMARIEAFMTNRFLSPPNITESEEMI